MRLAESRHGAGCGELLLRPPCPVRLDAIGAEPAVGNLGDQDAVDLDRGGTQGVPGDAGARSQFARVQLEPVKVTVEVTDDSVVALYRGRGQAAARKGRLRTYRAAAGVYSCRQANGTAESWERWGK